MEIHPSFFIGEKKNSNNKILNKITITILPLKQNRIVLN
jgi:hypothetical protein